MNGQSHLFSFLCEESPLVNGVCPGPACCWPGGALAFPSTEMLQTDFLSPAIGNPGSEGQWAGRLQGQVLFPASPHPVSVSLPLWRGPRVAPPSTCAHAAPVLQHTQNSFRVVFMTPCYQQSLSLRSLNYVLTKPSSEAARIHAFVVCDVISNLI